MRLPPLSTDPDCCERAFVGNTIGQANGVYDKSLALRLCDFINEKSNLYDADKSQVVMSKAYAVGASFKSAKTKSVDLSNAVLDRVNFAKTDLEGAVFRNTVLSGSTFEDANLEGADFEDTIIGYIDLQKLCTNKTISGLTRDELGCR
ncbi:hypothetical protein TanjilG_08079 [Lupinus angustifolius]|uniref:Pentapeptide repeat-containing protein n=1 Tax=Lupinus angustifolius TaxID=3871 RepID=A0A1J7I9N6_LUPAN|nr:hypothetical protein TanjilG_08079 [Lupinus angustifolius]